MAVITILNIDSSLSLVITRVQASVLDLNVLKAAWNVHSDHHLAVDKA